MDDLEKELLGFFSSLSEADRRTVTKFAAFLAEQPYDSAKDDKPQSEDATQNEIPQPLDIPRPDDERIVDALKRLSETYPMLEKKPLLDKASGLVAKHVMFGEPANLVINEIEDLFKKQYDDFIANFGKN